MIAALESSDRLGGAALVIVLLKTWQGWRLGLVRQIVGLGALAVGGCGFLGSGAAGAMSRDPFTDACSRRWRLIIGFWLPREHDRERDSFREERSRGTLVRVGYGWRGRRSRV